MEAEIEALRREREDKIRQIAEKRKQVEELRKKRSEHIAAIERQSRYGKVDIEPDGHVSYERSCQTDMKGSDVGSGGEKSAAAAGSVSKSSANVLLRVADRAKNRVLTGTTASEERRLKRAAGQEAKADAERPEIKELSEED
eukprot:g28470.t1